MPNLRDIKKAWKKLITENEWRQLFIQMDQFIHPESDLHNEFIGQWSRYRDIYKKEMGVTLDSTQIEVAYNRLRESTLKIIHLLDENDIGTSITSTFTSSDYLSSIKIDFPISPLYVVNCDRKENGRKFRRNLRKWEKEHLRTQFYISLGCPTQKPDGFAERIVFEIMEKKMKHQTDHFDYPRDARQRLKIAELPTGLDIDDCMAGMKKYMAERFELGHTELEDFLANKLLQRQSGTLVFPFNVPVKDWDEDPELMIEYFDWIFDTFGESRNNGPTCIFIFIAQLKNAHFPEKVKYNREVLDGMQDLSEQYPDKLCFLYPFKQVPRYYLESWLSDIDRNITKPDKNIIIEQHLKRFYKKLPPDFESDDFLIDMELIQQLQEKIWEMHQ